MTTKNLSKLQAWLAKILSVSSLLSKMKKTTWFPKSLILKALRECQSCEKFLTIASVLRTHFVKNFAAKINSLEPILDRSLKPSPSGPCKDNLLQPSVISSIKRVKKSISQTPRRKAPQAFSKQEFTKGTDKPSKRRIKNFYNLGEVKNPNFR